MLNGDDKVSTVIVLADPIVDSFLTAGDLQVMETN